MQSSGQAFSHCLHPMQSSILTCSLMRERALRSPSGTMSDFQRSSGFSSAWYCWVTEGMKMCLRVTAMPLATVTTASNISVKYFLMVLPLHFSASSARQGKKARHDEERERDRYQVLPAHGHQLIDPQPGQSPAQPHLDEYQKHGLGKEGKCSGHRRRGEDNLPTPHTP